MIAESTRQFSRPTMWTKYQTDGQKTAMYRVSEGKIIFLNLFLTVRFDCWSNRGRTVSISWKLSISQDFKTTFKSFCQSQIKKKHFAIRQTVLYLVGETAAAKKQNRSFDASNHPSPLLNQLESVLFYSRALVFTYTILLWNSCFKKLPEQQDCNLF